MEMGKNLLEAGFARGASLDGQTLVEVLHARANDTPEQTAAIFLNHGAEEAVSWSYRDIAFHAARIAGRLSALDAAGKKAVLLYEPGLEYIAALFGVMQAGAIAVPSFPPMGTRALQRLASIIDDARPEIILSTARIRAFEKNIRQHCQQQDKFDWLTTDELANSQEPESASPLQPQSLALLQYTSGSTGQPKGVMISHANLVSNSRALLQSLAPAGQRAGCSWLPPYHDMGLMGGILLPLYAGFPVTLFSPARFVQNPARWLRAISQYRVNVTVAPNFALDLCVDSITDDDIEGVDLSSVTELFCGAEPIRKETFDRFCRRFARYGFRRAALNPCYGLAEATLYVTGKKYHTAPRHGAFDQTALDANRALEIDEGNTAARFFISCGEAADRHQVRIVDPDTCEPCQAGQIGEIWVAGPNVAQGYWQREQETAATFHATLTGESGRFMRTGDLGFLRDGELFVTGRIKDVIIIAGRNHYPQDIELTAQNAHPEVRTNGVAAFHIDAEHGEALVIVAEVRRRVRGVAANVREVREAVISHTAAMHGVRPHAVHIGPIGTLPLTTSGKVQRRKCREQFLEGRLPVLHDLSEQEKASHAHA